MFSVPFPLSKMLKSPSYSLQPTDVILLETYTFKFVGKTDLILDVDTSAVAEQTFTVQTAFEMSTSLHSFGV